MTWFSGSRFFLPRLTIWVWISDPTWWEERADPTGRTLTPHVCAVVGKHLNSSTYIIMHTYIVEKSTGSCYSHLLWCSCSHSNVSSTIKTQFNSGLRMTRIQASNGLAWLGSSWNIATNFMSFLIFPVVIDKDLPHRAECRHWLPRTLSFPTLRQTLLFMYSRISYLPASASKILA